ncbi:MAG: hypothetical protein QOH72_2511 [Solirubrobacteraceae bacterium]|jgi:hypothetical protein|nr:hypothetical protein [Solirubrobacteraceae bacterium]
MSSTAAVPASTTLSTLRTRHDSVARHVTRCEANVERLRSELALPPIFPGATPPAERAMISAVRDLVEARGRLAQISRELRRAEGEPPARPRYVR